MPSAGVLFSLDFEDAAVDSLPEGWYNFVGYVPNSSQNSRSGSSFVLVDSQRARSGSKSLYVKGGSNGPTQMVKRLPEDLDRLYVRTWVYMDHSMGNDAGDNHEHILGVKAYEGGDDSQSFSANNEVRVGQGKGHLGFNHLPTDAISPEYGQWGSGPTTPVDTWYCVEAEFLADQPYHELHMYVDGVLVNSVQEAGDWHAPVPANWLDGKMGYVMFGWHSFSGNSANIWFDDIVVSTEPVGCN